MLLFTVGYLLYMATDNDLFIGFLSPVHSLLVGDTLQIKLLRSAVFFVFPLVIGYLVYNKATPQYFPPIESRQAHVGGPASINFKGEKDLVLQETENPLRNDKSNFASHVEEGRQVYFKNCMLCHGDNVDGAGLFADGLNPRPANFRDQTTIAQLQESYVFWRVAKGGPGFGEEGTPWNSAMPVWETFLTEDEIWKVILYIYDASGFQPRTWEKEPAKGGSAPSGTTTASHSSALFAKPAYAQAVPSDDIKKVYLDKCSGCHGLEGAGDGPAADFLRPRPRDFTFGTYKFRTTASGELPTDADLTLTIKKGLPGSSMPAWEGAISDSDINGLIHYIKSFSERFKDATPPKTVALKNPPTATADSIKRGRAAFDKAGCVKCHGNEGRGDGPSFPTLTDDWDQPILPTDLHKPWTLRNGAGPADIFRTVTTGLNGSPMPSFADTLTDDERSDLANYISSLFDRRTSDVVVKSKLIRPSKDNPDADLPTTPDDTAWASAPFTDFTLIGQVSFDPRNFTPTLDHVRVQSVYNEFHVAFKLTYGDHSDSRPPAPGAATPAGGDESDVSEAPKLPDSFAIQFPSALPEPKRPKPYFMDGDHNLSVDLWTWTAGESPDKDTLRDIVASGQKPEDHREDPALSKLLDGKAVFKDGQRQIVIQRSLTTEGGAGIQFQPGVFIPIAFSGWDGFNGDEGMKKSVSAWYYLILEPPKPIQAYFMPPFAL
ncbi:MAG: c-type cytochrome, partial [bacterium]